MLPRSFSVNYYHLTEMKRLLAVIKLISQNKSISDCLPEGCGDDAAFGFDGLALGDIYWWESIMKSGKMAPSGGTVYA